MFFPCGVTVFSFWIDRGIVLLPYCFWSSCLLWECPLLYSFFALLHGYSFLFFYYHYYLFYSSPPGYLILESSFWLLWDFPNFLSGFTFSLYLSSSLSYFLLSSSSFLYTILHIRGFLKRVFVCFLFKQRGTASGFCFHYFIHGELYFFRIPFIYRTFVYPILYLKRGFFYYIIFWLYYLYSKVFLVPTVFSILGVGRRGVCPFYRPTTCSCFCAFVLSCPFLSEFSSDRHCTSGSPLIYCTIFQVSIPACIT